MSFLSSALAFRRDERLGRLFGEQLEDGRADARLLEGVLLDLLRLLLVLDDERQVDAEEPRGARIGEVHHEGLERDDPGRRRRRLGLRFLGLGRRGLHEVEVRAGAAPRHGEEDDQHEV